MNEHISDLKQRPTRQLLLFDVLAVLFIAHKLLPVVGYVMPSFLYFGIFLLLWFVIMLDGKVFSATIKLLPVFVCSLIKVIFDLFTGSGSAVPLYLYGQLQILLYGAIGIFIIKNRSEKQAKRWFVFIITCYMITAVTTLIGCLRFPMASRYLATNLLSGAEHSLYVKNNIGGFAFLYELVLVMPLLIYLAKNRKIKSILSAIIFVVIGFAIISSEYTTALMLVVMNLLLLFFRKLTPKKIVVLIIIFLVIVLIFSSLLASFFDLLADSFDSAVLSSRFQYIAATLRGDEIEEIEETSDRMTLYKKAIDEIIESKFLGNWGKRSGSGHSMLLDTVVTYGILGIAALVVMYRAIYKYAVYPYKNKSHGPYLVWIYLSAFLLALLNPNANLPIFIFVIPLFAKMMDDTNEAR